MRQVGVFPAKVKEPAVVHHHGIEVVVLLEAKLADIPAVGIHAVEHGHVAEVAGHALKAGRAAEGDPPVGQVAGVVTVDVGLVAPRHLPQARAVGANFEHLPAAGGVGHREQEPPGVELEVHVAHELAALGPEEGREGSFGGDRLEDGDLIVIHALGQRRVACRASRQPEVPAEGREGVGRLAVADRPPLDHQEAVEVQERIGLKRLLGQGRQGVGRLLVAAVLGRRSFERFEPSQVLGALGVSRPEGLDEIDDGQPE